MKMIRNLGVITVLILLALSNNIMAQTAKDALNVGDKAINFTLENSKGEKVTLYDELKKGPVVLTWYRGGWCPFCNVALGKLQSKLPEIKAAGATLIAISPQVPDQSLSTEEKQKLQFNVLSDVGNKVGKQYNLVFKLDDATLDRYENGFGLSKYNGDTKGELPIPATYVIGTDKVIKYAFVDENYKLRADTETILTSLSSLQKNKNKAEKNKVDKSNELVVIWTSDDPYVAERVALMYTHASKRNKWFENVTLIVWGPSAKLIAENVKLQEKVKQMIADGIVVEACSACSNAYGTTQILKDLGYDAKPMGVPLTEYLKSGAKVLTF